MDEDLYQFNGFWLQPGRYWKEDNELNLQHVQKLMKGVQGTKTNDCSSMYLFLEEATAFP